MRLGRALLGATVLVGLALSVPTSVLASIGPYTRPIFDTGLTPTQAYGCTDRTDEWPSPPSGQTCDPGQHWHAGIDYGGSRDVASAWAGTVVKVVKNKPDGDDSTLQGNYIVIDHGSGQFSQYWHLKFGSILVNTTDKKHVSAGQKIAVSDDTGASDGSHLHFQLTTSKDENSPNYSLDPNNLWTTGGSGRVPWKHPATTWYADVCLGDTVTFVGSINNNGGRLWSATDDAYGRGRIILFSTDSSGETQTGQPVSHGGLGCREQPGRLRSGECGARWHRHVHVRPVWGWHRGSGVHQPLQLEAPLPALVPV
jgi:hypothetical protein